MGLAAGEETWLQAGRLQPGVAARLLEGSVAHNMHRLDAVVGVSLQLGAAFTFIRNGNAT